MPPVWPATDAGHCLQTVAASLRALSAATLVTGSSTPPLQHHGSILCCQAGTDSYAGQLAPSFAALYAAKELHDEALWQLHLPVIKNIASVRLQAQQVILSPGSFTWHSPAGTG